MGPKEPRSTVRSVEDEAMVVAFRRHTLLPLDDYLYALQPTIPQLTRSSLHCCLQRHGISRLHDVAIDRTSKFALVQLHGKATQRIAAAFLHDLATAVPYTIHTVLTDNGIQCTDTRPVNEEVEAQITAY